MITDVLTSYLEDEKVEDNKKYELLQRCNLNYSDLFYLRSLYKYNQDIYKIVDAAFVYEDVRLKEKIKKQNRKFRQSARQKKIRQVRRQKSYD